MIQSNISVQVAIILCSALAMGGMGVLGHYQAQQKNYNPALMPSLSVVASAFLLNMMISASSEDTVQHMHWPTGIILFAILIGCNYLSSATKSSLRLRVSNKTGTTTKSQLLHQWNTQLQHIDSTPYFGEDTTYQYILKTQLTKEINNVQYVNGEFIFNILYDKSVEEGTQATELPIVLFVKNVFGKDYNVHSEVNKTGGISIGLAVAVIINFVMDGLLAGNEITFNKDTTHPFFQFGYMKLNNIFGFIFDNLILMLILGYQFARSAMDVQQQSIYLIAIVGSFIVSMCLGMFTTISSSIDTQMANTIVFVVTAYTV